MDTKLPASKAAVLPGSTAFTDGVVLAFVWRLRYVLCDLQSKALLYHEFRLVLSARLPVHPDAGFIHTQNLRKQCADRNNLSFSCFVCLTFTRVDAWLFRLSMAAHHLWSQ